jgi:hypothetical protein
MLPPASTVSVLPATLGVFTRFSVAIRVLTYGMHTSLIENQGTQNIYHLVTRRFNGGEVAPFFHLSSLQNIRIKHPDVDVLQR